MALGDNIYNNVSKSYITQAGCQCPSQYVSLFPNQSTWQGTLRPETWTEQGVTAATQMQLVRITRQVSLRDR